MTRSNTIAAALAALTFATTFTAFAGEAQAHHAHWGRGAGLGFAAGALIGAVAASSAYAAPTYSYTECQYVRRYDRWGYPHTVRVCDAVPY